MTRHRSNVLGSALGAISSIARWSHGAGALALGLLLAVAGCGGSDEPAAVPAGTMIGAAGGTVDGPNGARVVIPAGALTQPVAISVTQSTNGLPAMPDDVTPLGQVYSFTPHGTTFLVPVTLRVPLDPALAEAGFTPRFYKTDAAMGGWAPLPGAVVSGNFIEVPSSSFSGAFGGLAGERPTIKTEPKLQSVVAPAAATFVISAGGPTKSGKLTYQWYRKLGASGKTDPIAGATAESYTTPATSLADNDSYFSVVVTNNKGFITSDEARLVVSAAPVPVKINGGPDDAEVFVGASNEFKVMAEGTAPLYRWLRSNDGGATFSEVATTASYSIVNAQLADNDARFKVVISNSVSSAESRLAKLTVRAVPPPVTIASAPRISAGDGFSLAVNATGTAYSWGSDAIAGLGNGPADANVLVPTALASLTGVRSVAAGSHGVAVLNNGEVWAWGYRGYVDCAFGQTADSPFKIPGAVDIVAAAAGEEHTLLLDKNGFVFSFGCTGDPQLGRAGAGAVAAQVLFPGLPAGATITALAAGGGFSLALDSNNKVWSWGRGQLGYGTAQSMQATPQIVPNLAAATAIAAGRSHALVLLSNGAVVGWGQNTYGEVGDGTQTARLVPTPTVATPAIKAIAAGASYSLAIRTDGIALSWGINGRGELGGGPTAPTVRPTPGPVLGLVDVVAIAAGGGVAHSMAVLADDSVWAWGTNTSGQVGDGTTTSRSTPVPASGLKLK